MSEWFDRSVYDDVADEARADYLAERPDPDYPDPSEYECGRCGRPDCDGTCQ
jgi:hypothetical protein